MLRALQDLGFDLTVYATKDYSQAASPLFRRVEVVAGRGPTGIREYLNARWGPYDAVIVSRPHNMQYLKAAIGRRLMDAATPVIYDAEAISAMRTIGRRRLLGELVDDEEAARLIRDETSLANSCAVVLAVNQAERQLFAEAGATNAIELGHAVSVRATVQVSRRAKGSYLSVPSIRPLPTKMPCDF